MILESPGFRQNENEMIDSLGGGKLGKKLKYVEFSAILDLMHLEGEQ